MRNLNSNVFFFTATNYCWKLLLQEDEHKNIIINSLDFLVKDKRINVLGFVIMPNHIHLIWQILDPYTQNDVQRDFLKYTAQQIRFNLIKTNSPLLDEIIVNAKDRKIQIWERNSLSFKLDNTKTLIQKLNYIHANPIQEKWSLSDKIENYFHSSASFYLNETSPFLFLTRFEEIM